MTIELARSHAHSVRLVFLRSVLVLRRILDSWVVSILKRFLLRLCLGLRLRLWLRSWCWLFLWFVLFLLWAHHEEWRHSVVSEAWLMPKRHLEGRGMVERSLVVREGVPWLGEVLRSGVMRSSLHNRSSSSWLSHHLLSWLSGGWLLSCLSGSRLSLSWLLSGWSSSSSGWP